MTCRNESLVADALDTVTLGATSLPTGRELSPAAEQSPRGGTTEIAMKDGFSLMLEEAIGFFRGLAENNSKEWFEPRKEFYQERIRKPADHLADILAEEISRRSGAPHAAKVYRIHRDVRFSKDKRPYNAHLHVLWSRAGAEGAPGWFFAASPEGVSLATGSPDFSGDALEEWRRRVDQDGDALRAAIDGACASLGAVEAGWGTPPLKRVPKPYDDAHPHAALLKARSFVITAPIDDWRERPLLDAILARVDGLLPVWQALHGETI